MSTAYSSAKQQYIGNGVTTEWGFDFPIKKHSELKVYLKRSGSTQVLLEEGVDYSFVTENTIAFPIKTGEAKLQASDVLALQRESVFESEYNFSNQQRLEPEEVMHADDNLERQIQELKRDSESAIKVLPTSNVDPNTFFEQVDRVYGSVDNIDTVANDKANVDAVSGSITNVNTVAGSIESVKTVANNIESVVVDATNISDIKTVAGSITNVNKTAGSIDNVNVVAPSISSVNTVAANISSVNTAASNMADIKAAPTAASNAAQSAANAANSATISANSAIWAEGTDAQVAALGGVHSSKGWAQQSTNANIALTNSPYTTNRILEIPQDIKLELNNGTLTLKAGSEVYVPNGFEADGTTPKFDTLNIQNDVVFTQVTASGTNFLFYTRENNLTRHVNVASGTSIPSGFTGIFYNTSTNHIYYCNNGTGTDESSDSFPIAIVTVADNQTANVASIDQVFNGFGYIGSTLFVLPGVKVQIPNGRNEDGTCKSIYGTIRTVQQTSVNPGNGDSSIRIGDNYISVSKFVYDEKTNYNYNQTVSPSNIRYQTNAGTVSYLSGRITSFEPFTVDSVVNSNEFYQLKDKAVTTDTAQTITGFKAFNNGSGNNRTNIDIITNDGVGDDTNVKWAGSIQFKKGNMDVGFCEAMRDSVNSSIAQITAHNSVNGQEVYASLRSVVTSDGNTFAMAPTPSIGVTGEEIATAGWVNTKLGGFANTNASNFTATGKETIVGWGMPDYSAGISISAGASGNYTAPSKGLLSISVYTKDATANIYVNNNLVSRQASGGAYLSLDTQVFVDKNDVIRWENIFSGGSVVFFPLKGVN